MWFIRFKLCPLLPVVCLIDWIIFFASGKGGSNVNRLKEETGVTINIPDEKSSSIRIEGTPQGVEQAKAELLEMVAKMENERERDIIIEQRFHKNIIGAKGEKIREIRDMFHQVTIRKHSLIATACVVSTNNSSYSCYRYKLRFPSRPRRVTW